MSVGKKKERSGLRWSKYPALVTAAALALSLSCSIVSAAAPTGYYDWEAGADKTAQEIYNRVAAEMESYYGPGMIRVESETEAAPVVNESNLSERYHEKYQVYEESLAGRFFFYSSVANGGITHEEVILDMPANLIYSFEKDGQPWQWTPGQKIGALGTYVISITAVEDTSLPLSEQKEHNAVFRFRIQEEPPEPETEETSMNDPYNMGYGYGSQYYPEGSAPFGMESNGNWAIETPTEAPIETAAEETTEAPEETEAVQETEVETTAAPVRTQEYDGDSGRYLVTLENGEQMVTNIPEGYVGPMAVQVMVDEEKSDLVTVYHNDAEVEYIRGNQFTEPGQYRVVMDGYAFSFTNASYVSEMDRYQAPVGMTFKSCMVDGEEISLESSRYVAMAQDGSYFIVMEGESGEALEVSLIKDTVPPEVNVTVKSGTASVQYLTEDTQTIILTKDGQKVENFGGYTVSEPGKYTLTVTDKAGNSTINDFTIKYQVNGYGIAAVILVIILIAGIAAFVVRTKKSITVR